MVYNSQWLKPGGGKMLSVSGKHIFFWDKGKREKVG